jgi:hypothetical protein
VAATRFVPDAPARSDGGSGGRAHHSAGHEADGPADDRPGDGAEPAVDRSFHRAGGERAAKSAEGEGKNKLSHWNSLRVFSSEVDAGSREENTIKQGIREFFRFNLNRKNSESNLPDPRLKAGRNCGWAGG